jgi:hypothetical protein
VALVVLPHHRIRGGIDDDGFHRRQTIHADENQVATGNQYGPSVARGNN